MISLIATKDLEEGTSRGIEIDNNFLFAIKKDDLYHVYWNICPHIGTPLEWQEDQFLDDDGELIRCATHGALFEINSGKCLAGPCIGKKLHKIPFEISNDMIIVKESDLKSPSRF